MLTLWNGFDRALNRELRNMDRLFWTRPFAPSLRHTGWPRVNVVETETALEIQADVPGMTADDIEVTLHDGELKLEGKLAGEQEQSEGQGEERKVLFNERRNLAFTRTFKLNVDVDAEGVTAAVKDGVLTVVLPKAEAEKPRQIRVATQ